jgi:hypothetical protein
MGFSEGKTATVYKLIPKIYEIIKKIITLVREGARFSITLA